MCEMNCVCPLQEVCDTYRMLDELEDANIREELGEQIMHAEMALIDDENYYSTMRQNARNMSEFSAADTLARSSELASRLEARIAEDALKQLDTVINTRHTREEREEQYCSGPKVRRKFKFFGKVMLNECGSNARKKRLGLA